MRGAGADGLEVAMKPGNGAADEAVSLAGESPAPALGQSPGSVLDCRGGNESAESSSEKPSGAARAVPSGQEGKRTGGPQH
jgi:hypothetical protein